MSKRIDIMTALGSQLQAIATDRGIPLLYWQDYPTEYGGDAIVYRDLAEEAPIEKGNDHEHLLHVEIEGRVFNALPGLEANLMLDEISQAIASDITLGNKAIKVIFAGNETDVDTEGKTAARVLFKLDVLYRTAKYAT